MPAKRLSHFCMTKVAYKIAACPICNQCFNRRTYSYHLYCALKFVPRTSVFTKFERFASLGTHSSVTLHGRMTELMLEATQMGNECGTLVRRCSSTERPKKLGFRTSHLRLRGDFISLLRALSRTSCRYTRTQAGRNN